MDNNELLSRIAFLESKVDMLESELAYLNEILMQCGFQDGIKTLKMTVEELIKEQQDEMPYPKKGGSLEF